MKLRGAFYDSPVGRLTLISSDVGLRAVLWPDDEERVRIGQWIEQVEHPILTKTAAQLEEYFGHERTNFDLPLDPVGTEFQHLVWRRLQSIPYGETTSYGAVAASVDRPEAARAVGAANGRNPISIIVPCHRVIAASGALAGFAGGLGVKQQLLDHESELNRQSALRS